MKLFSSLWNACKINLNSTELRWLLSLSSHIHNFMKNGAQFLINLHLIPSLRHVLYCPVNTNIILPLSNSLSPLSQCFPFFQVPLQLLTLHKVWLQLTENQIYNISQVIASPQEVKVKKFCLPYLLVFLFLCLYFLF